MDPEYDLHYILNHLGEERDRHRGAVAPPVYQTSNFCFDDVPAMRLALADELKSSFYTRGNNPTVETLRRKLAALEGAEDALAFSSGSGAVSAAVIAFVSQGDHVVCVNRPYSWTRVLLRDMLPRFGVSTTFVDGTDSRNFADAITEKTRMIVVESPNSMTFEQQDLRAVADLAKAHGLITLCDNSWASPLHQSPIACGIDLVVHSATKYLNGHSDVVAGAVCGGHQLIQQIFRGPFMTLGAVLSPHDAWLMIRGLRTLEVRMARIAQTTAEVAAFLAGHPKIRQLLMPGAPGDPQAELGARQLKGQSGLLSIRVAADDLAAVDRFCASLECFLLACSWGSYESLAFPVACLMKEESYRSTANPLPYDLIRLSIGLEPASALIADLESSLAQL